ncbi:nuclear transport factor 2 family protein [Planosporangium mesophilum]|uniref:nuclear transport factor 2 family protein n=1 Tax=Planosporangium mesophilum TaxID=689768 RepID=UPI00197B97E2|nr:nuclear transport factor 2 family protein [Planosporangium mesophilum]
MTRRAAHGYLDAWTSGDLDGVRRLLAEDAVIESNTALEPDVGGPASPDRLIDTLTRIAARLIQVKIITEVYEAGRAVLMYDCLVGEPADVIRVVEYLDVEGGLIRRIRQVYDVAALHRLVPPNA